MMEVSSGSPLEFTKATEADDETRPLRKEIENRYTCVNELGWPG